jgi:hypothetical protein
MPPHYHYNFFFFGGQLDLGLEVPDDVFLVNRQSDTTTLSFFGKLYMLN